MNRPVAHSAARFIMVQGPMRICLPLLLVGLSSCARQTAAPAPVAAPMARPASGTSTAAHEVVPPPGRATGPVVVIDDAQVTLEGRVVGSVRDIDRIGRLQKLDALFETLRSDRAAWKAAHGSEPFPGEASLVAAPGTSGLAFASVFQTVAFAGFPKIHVAVGERYYPTWASVPGPPCGTAENPCPSGPDQYILHVQPEPWGWRLRVPRDDGPLDRMGDGAESSVESFRASALAVMATERIGAVVLHVAPDVPFSRFAPFLAEVSGVVEQARLSRDVTLSVRAIDTVEGKASPAPVAAEGSVRGRLAPEAIQGVVRANFGALRKCYESVLAKSANAGGRTSTRFVIRGDGTVSDARTELSGNLPPEMGSCMEGVFKSLTFPATSGGQVAVTYPVVFDPGQ